MDDSLRGLEGVRSPTPSSSPACVKRGPRRLGDLLANEPYLMLVLAVEAVVLAIRLPNLLASDTWLALVAGRQLSANWLPHHDHLTILANGNRWVDQQWLSQLFMYEIQALGGLRLLLVVHLATLVTAFGGALCFARRSGGSPRSVALFAVAGLVVVLPNSALRPQAFAYGLFVGLFWLLATSSAGSMRRTLWALPLLVVWANVHGSVILGAGLMVIWGAVQVAGTGRRTDPSAWRARARAAALVAAALLSSVLTPYGPDVLGYYRNVLGSGAFRDLVTEWQAPTFPGQLPFFALALISLWLTARKPRALTVFEHLTLVFTLLAGFEAIRNIVWFALVAVMVVPRALDAVWPLTDTPVRRRVNVVLALGAATVIAGSLVAGATRSSASVDAGYSPEVASAVSAAAAGDPSLRVFANEKFADWLLWQDPSLAGRIAFDARFELLSATQLKALSHFRHHSSPAWLSAADGYRLVVLDPNQEEPALRAILREPGSRALYRSARVVVVLRGRAQ